MQDLDNLLSHFDLNKIDNYGDDVRMSDAELMEKHGLFKSSGRPMSLNAEADHDFDLDSFKI